MQGTIGDKVYKRSALKQREVLMKIRKIYFDMDGVLADFNKGVKELCKMEPENQATKSASYDDEMWSRIKAIPHYYDRLELMPGAKEMVSFAENIEGATVEILSGIPKPKRGIITAGEDKISWIHRLFDESIKVNIVYREEKKNYVTGKDCILIDDLEKNIKEWNESGGTGILYTSSEEVIETLKKLIES